MPTTDRAPDDPAPDDPAPDDPAPADRPGTGRATWPRTALSALVIVVAAGLTAASTPGGAVTAPADGMALSLRHPLDGANGDPVHRAQRRQHRRRSGRADGRTRQAVAAVPHRHRRRATGPVGLPTPGTSAQPGGAVPPLAPSGQVTRTGLLPAAATAFATPGTGWSPLAGAAVGQTSTVGHRAAGALSFVSGGAWSGAASPSFAVAPGTRYFASAWVKAASAAHRVGLALRFRDRDGAVIADGTTLGQTLVDDPSAWSRTLPVVGFAPAGAVNGELVFLDYGGSAGDGHWVDDVRVSSTSGTAAALRAPLTTRGRYVLDAAGRRVRFAGIDIDGLQYSSFAAATTGEIVAAQRWGANLVRIPLAENYLLPRDCLYQATYLDHVDRLVRAATGRGMFVLLDLHTLAVPSCTAPKQQVMPDRGAVRFWQIVAGRYKDNPLVGFDLYNEPHDVSDAVWHDGGTVLSHGFVYTAPGMQTLYDTVRATGATNLVFAGGTAWATRFPASAPLSTTRNLVYAVHAYTCSESTHRRRCHPGPGGVYDPSGILGDFTSSAAQTPVVVTEFGWPDRNDGRFLANVIAYVRTHGISGWDVYAFDNTTSGRFDLVKDTGPLYDPTPSGMAVVAGMRNT